MNFEVNCILSLVCLVFCALLLQRGFKPSLIANRVKRVAALLVLFWGVIPFYSLLLIITQRPVFSSSVCIIILLVILAVSNVKYSVLREPLVFTDFHLYLQAFKHPRLYLPFLDVLSIVLLVGVTGLAVFSGYYFEEARFSIISWKTLLLLVSIPLSLLMLSRTSKVFEITENASEDSKVYGVLVTLALYAVKSNDNHKKMQDCIIQASSFNSSGSSSPEDETLADVIIIQSESFFDARLTTPNVRKEVLQSYDLLVSESSVSGRLQVPAWGANTMRTEFAFLTGIDPKQLGLAQYYPYQQLLKYNVPSILNTFKKKGYYCICIHPHAASFFKRGEFFSKIGFDEFIDEQNFNDAERDGPYIADSAVTVKIKDVCERSEKPCFIFAITMENHGPLHLESVDKNEWSEYFYQQPDEGLDDLTVYLRHLKNADNMISDLNSYLLSREKDTLLGFYGDHVPAISRVFDKLNYHDSQSNYFVWSTWGAKSIHDSRTSDLVVENLAVELLEALESRV